MIPRDLAQKRPSDKHHGTLVVRDGLPTGVNERIVATKGSQSAFERTQYLPNLRNQRMARGLLLLWS